MRKSYTKSALCIASLILCINLHAQNCWSSLGSGVYTTSTNDAIYALTNYNGTIIAAGYFDSIGGVAASNIAAWNGSSWSALGSGVSGGFGFVNTMTVYNGDLYAAGNFDTAGEVPVNNIAKWNGSAWSAVGAGISSSEPSYIVMSMAVYNGALFVCGYFDTAGGLPAQNIAKWDGTSWSDIGGLRKIGGSQCNGGSLTVCNNMLYVGGCFDSIGNIAAYNIAAWNDTTWTALGSGVGVINPGYGAGISCIAFYQGSLYVGGFQNDFLSSGRYYIAKWNGLNWSCIEGDAKNISTRDGSGYIYSLMPFDGKLIIGGSFLNISDTISPDTSIFTNSIAQWDGTNWSGFGNGTNGPGPGQTNTGYVYTIDTFNGHLYIAGNFFQVDSTPANSIAEYTCATDGIREVTASDRVHLYPNPSTGMVNITIDDLQPGYSVGIYDLLGQSIFQSSINVTTTEINLSGQAPGTYLYRISDSGGENISAGMFIIQ